ncbi:M16 family metallopeptidase [Candidatus Margulisiibacteriota bacterium]
MKVIPDSKKTTLDNGLRIVTERIDTLRSISMGISVNTGSANESREISGISHLIEHMVFKGTPKRTAFQIANAFDSIGGRINAFTSKEMTFYYAVVLDKHFNIAVDVLSDILLNSLYDKKELETEKGVILEEVKMYEDSPDELIHDLFIETLFHGHPLGRPTIGSKESIKSMNRENIMQYLASFYCPDNMIISLAGDVHHDEVCGTLIPIFEKLKSCKKETKTLPPQINKNMKLQHKKTEQVHMCIGTRGASQINDDRYTLALLDNVLGGTMSSKLFQEIREKRGLAYSVYSYLSSFRNAGLLTVYAGTSKKNFKKAVELIVEQLGKIKKEGITKKELAGSKEHLKGSTVLGLESSQSRMSWLARSEFYYEKVLTIDDVFDKIDKVTNDDILRVANEFIRDEYLSLTVIGDLKEKDLPQI